MKVLYSIGILGYVYAIRLVSPFNTKAKKWLTGRKNWNEDLRNALKDKKNVYWFHCASLGEFEQGRPLMEKVKQKDPNVSILVTFFSPSGYELRKHYEVADYVCYLPMDSAKNAKKFITAIDIKKAFFIKYEFWYHYFKELSKREIEFYMVSAVFRENQIFFKWYANWYRNILLLPTNIFVQDKVSKELLTHYGIKSVVTGDTRYDKVLENKEKAKKVPFIEKFKGEDFLLVAGSSWQPEEQLLSQLKVGGIKLIIAPHDVKENHIREIENRFKETIRYSNNELFKEEKVLIIDSIGMLYNLYQYADLAFIGGGFSGALHNILEPAAFGAPVVFGTKHKKYREAKEMLIHGSAFEVLTKNDLEKVIDELLKNRDYYEQCKQINQSFIQERTGATLKIIKYI